MKTIVTLVVDSKVVDQFSSIRAAYAHYSKVAAPSLPVHYATFCRRMHRGFAKAYGVSSYTLYNQWHFYHAQVDNIDTDTKPPHLSEREEASGSHEYYPDAS